MDKIIQRLKKEFMEQYDKYLDKEITLKQLEEWCKSREYYWAGAILKIKKERLM